MVKIITMHESRILLILKGSVAISDGFSVHHYLAETTNLQYVDQKHTYYFIFLVIIMMTFRE